ncbi:hypothetical protein NDA18_001664 [Ustilago nuda]|nr:hypothetical protein NDA18_001664 [Ustilago nuda]
MKAILTLYTILLTLSCLTQALSLSAPPLRAENSLSSSIRSFESAWSHLDSAIEKAEAKGKAFATRERWATGIAAGLSVLGTAGYIASSAIPRIVKAKKEHLKLQSQLASKRKSMVRRNLEEALAKEGESFYSTLRQSSSERMEDFDHEELLQYHTPMNLQRSASAPSPGGDKREWGRRNTYRVQEDIRTHDRLEAVEQAILGIKRKQHEETKRSRFQKVLLGATVLSAVGGLASAGLSVQNAVEAAEGKS